ncbi:MAG: hypothetical protein HYX27_02810 [Acidobacteria bacterium]|nr:hypothetical protein [Acidobacteriota bacterium]
MKRILMGLAFGVALMAQPYGARPGYGPGYNDSRGYAYNGNHFAERIARGERMGLLTRREASRLWDMERRLRYETERAYRSGYGVSPREQQRLAEMSRRLDYEITREMRDGERSGWSRW